MAKEKDKISKDDKYNKGREPLFRVEIVKGDTPEVAKEMRNMKDALYKKSEEDNQNLKQTVTAMYRHAKETGFFDKKDCE